MARKSAGLLMYRIRAGQIEVLLVHPGGPFWTQKDEGAWSIPKGEFTDEEPPLDAARREFQEETGFPPSGTFRPLAPIKQAGGKIVHAWAVEGDLDATAIRSNTFCIEWPPRSGQRREFPEVDRAEWFAIPAARERILAGQRGFLDELERSVATGGPR